MISSLILPLDVQGGIQGGLVREPPLRFCCCVAVNPLRLTALGMTWARSPMGACY